jgi:septal ring factor EnvC (AmiA/AmiB activator)
MLRGWPPVLISTLLVAAVATAQPRPANQRQDLQKLAGQAQDKGFERDDLRAEAQATQREIDSLKARLATLAAAQVTGKGVTDAERARFEALNIQEEALRERLDANRSELSRLLGALQLYSRHPPPALIVSPRSANDAATAAILMKAITPELERRARTLAAEAASFQRVRRQTELAHSTLFTSESEAAEQRAEIERLIAEKTGLEARLQADAQTADRQARALAERVAALGGLVRGVGQQELRAPEQLAGEPTRLIRPVDGTPAAGFGRASQGLSWRTAALARVRAPGSGRVEYAGRLKGWGQVVVIGLGGPWRLILAGLGRVSVAPGSAVSAGELVGVMGQDRSSTELYLELRRDDQPVDPSRRLDGR